MKFELDFLAYLLLDLTDIVHLDCPLGYIARKVVQLLLDRVDHGVDVILLVEKFSVGIVLHLVEQLCQVGLEIVHLGPQGILLCKNFLSLLVKGLVEKFEEGLNFVLLGDKAV